MKERISFYKTILISALLFLLVFIPDFIVGQQSVLRGIVTDQEGNTLKNVKIVMQDPSRGTRFTFKTNKEGKFIKVGIPPSLYLIKVELDGYFPFKSRFRVRFGIEENLKIKLKKIPCKVVEDKILAEDKNLAEGINFFKQGEYKEAIKSFEKVTHKYPDNFLAFYNLGLSYLRNGDIDEAIISLDKAIKIKPDLVKAYFALGECYFNKGDREKAMKTFLKAKELQPDNAEAHYNLGINYYKWDKQEEAIESFEKCIELDPNYSSAYYQLALVYIKKGDFKKAIKLLEEFLRMEQDAPEAKQVEAIIEALRKQIDKNEN